MSTEEQRLRSSTEVRADHLYNDEQDEEEGLEEEYQVSHSPLSPLSPTNKSPQGRAASDAALAAMGVKKKSGISEVEMKSLLRETEEAGAGVEDYAADVEGAEGEGRAIVPGGQSEIRRCNLCFSPLSISLILFPIEGQVEIWTWSQSGYLAQYFAVGLIYGGLPATIYGKLSGNFREFPKLNPQS